MEKMQDRVVAFLSDQGMYYGDISIQRTCNGFLAEMDKGLAGRKSSLAMLPTYVETDRDVPRNKPVIVMDAGGTNFRVATVTFKRDGKAQIADFEVYPMPGITAEVSKDDFFGTMAGYVSNIADRSRSVGFCFSYPIEMSPNKDGRVLYFSKEIKAPGVVGRMVGESLGQALRQQGIAQKKHFVLLNDTVATLLAGKADTSGRHFDTYIGFILGTGTNTSYVERNANILKAADVDPDRSQIVNIESGAFGKAPRGEIDKQLDAASVGPGINIFEKMISGAYLGPLCQATALAAAKAGLFSRAVAGRLTGVTVATKDISGFLARPEGGSDSLAKALSGAPQEDITTLYYLVDALVERAARLTAINLSSVALKSGKGLNPCRPVCIVAEGTTFYRLTSMRRRIERYLQEFLVEQYHVYYEIINVENATLIGAAIAGLTN